MHLKAQMLEEELHRTKAEAEEQMKHMKDEAAKEKKARRGASGCKGEGQGRRGQPEGHH